LPVLIAAKVGLVWSRLLDLGDAVLVMVGLEALIVLTGIGEIFLFARRYQHGRASGLDLWASLEEGLNVLVPGKMARLILQELRILAALFRWSFRRNRLAENEFAYHKRSMLQTIVPLVVVTSSVEVLVVHLLAYAFFPWVWVKWALLALRLYAIFWLLGFYASLVTLPHGLEESGLRLRYGTLARGFVP
jgi:hypothetical protein